MINEAVFALQEGLASAEEIDAGMRLGCNHPIGPLALCDLIGLDVQLAVMEVLYSNFNDSKYRPRAAAARNGRRAAGAHAGMLGRKTGRGFYTYEDERAEFASFIAVNPEAGSVVRGSGGVRKVRWAREGSGKSGGMRIVYVTRIEAGEVYLLTLYAKSKSENISLDTLKEIRRALEI
jgi:3-hydroxyacyl-CoA dehydrogenase